MDGARDHRGGGVGQIRTGIGRLGAVEGVDDRSRDSAAKGLSAGKVDVSGSGDGHAGEGQGEQTRRESLE